MRLLGFIGGVVAGNHGERCCDGRLGALPQGTMAWTRSADALAPPERFGYRRKALASLCVLAAGGPRAPTFKVVA